MKKQFVRVLSFMMALMMVVATFGTVAVFAAVDACDHSSDKVKTFVHDPQCNAIGFTSNVCECGYTWTSDIKGKVDCVGEPVEATEATCTEPAYAAGEQCKWCGTIISGCEAVGEPLGHKMAYVTVDATCTQINKIVYGCQVCDYVELDPVDLPDVINPEEPDGHNFVYEIVTRPSCELEEVTATTPGAYLVNGSTTIYTTDDAVQVVVDGVISEKYYIVVTTDGTAKYACTDCDRTYTEIVVKWNDTLHVWEDKEYGEDTCEGTLYEWTECSVCGMYKADTLVETNDVVHEWDTATEEEFEAWLEENADATIEVPYLDSTCAETGHNLLYCPNCETYDLQTIGLKEHNWQTATDEQFEAWLEENPDAEIEKPYVASTCKDAGHDLQYCDGCEGYQLVDLDLASHTKGDFYQKIDPTCTNWGEVWYDCPYCDEYYKITKDTPNLTDEEKAEIAPLGHLYDLVKVVEPTCTEDGYTIYGCTRCDKAYNAAKDAFEGDEADFVFEGEFTELKREAGDEALGHDFAYSCPACGEDAGCPDCTHEDRIATCQRCDHVEDASYDEHAWAEEITYMYMNDAGEFVVFEDYEEGDHLCDRVIFAYVFCTREGCECSEARPEENVAAAEPNDPTATHIWKIMEGADHKDPDCVNDGWVTITCDLCNISVSSLNNIYGVDVCAYAHPETYKADGSGCSANGNIVENCWKAYGHKHVVDENANITEEIEATCLTPGYRPAKVCEHCACELCDVDSDEHQNEYGEINGELDPANHDEDCVIIEIREVPPTCKQDGYNYVCRTCYCTEDEEGNPVLVFKPANPEVDVYPEDYEIEELRGQPIPKTLPKDPYYHWHIDADNGGVIETTQNGLEKVYTEYKVPTCVEKGNEAYYTCTFCGKYIVTTEDGVELPAEEWVTSDTVPEIAIDPDNHADLQEYVEYKAPKCLEEGNYGYTYCAACEKYRIETDAEGNRLNETRLVSTEEETKIAPTYHVGTVVEVEAVYETCDEIGWTYYAFCTACTEDNEAEVLEYVREKDGKTYHYTSETDDIYCFETKGIVFVTKNGDKWEISKSSANLYRPIPAHGDKYQVSNDEEVTPTCSTPGLLEATFCKRCDGAYLIEGWKEGDEYPWDETSLYSENSPFYVAPLGHDSETVHDDVYGQWDSVTFFEGCEANADVYCCEKYMCTAYWCVWCHDVEALDWDEVEYEFNEDGTYAVELDENGDASWFVEVDYFKNGHTWVEDEKAPTCFEDGYKYEKCLFCACVRIGEIIESKGHGYMNGDEWVELDLSCTNIENVLGITCDGCGNVSIEDAEHNWAHVEIEETCLEDGLEFWHCTWCYAYAVENEDGELEITERENAEQVIDDIDPDEHAFGSIVPDSYVAPTTTSTGLVQYVCARCGEIVDVVIPMLDGSLNLQLYASTYDVANGDTVEISVVLNSNYEEGFEFSALEMFFDYNPAMLEFLGYTVDHDGTIATEAASNESLMGGDAYISVISYAVDDSATIVDDMAYITFSFKVKGALPSYYFLGDFGLIGPNRPAMGMEPAWFMFDYAEAYDENGNYMEMAEFTTYNDDEEFAPKTVGEDYVNGYNFGYGIEFYPDLTGDIDYNGRIDTGDLVAFRDLVKAKEYDNVADINKDGVVNGADIVLLKKFLATNRTYCDYQAMMGVDWWAEFEASVAEALPYINLLLDMNDKEHLAYLLEEYVYWTEEFELYEEDAALLASIILSIKDDITLEQFMTAAKMMGVITEEMGVNYYGLSVDYATEALVMITLSILVNNDFPY